MLHVSNLIFICINFKTAFTLINGSQSQIKYFLHYENLKISRYKDRFWPILFVFICFNILFKHEIRLLPFIFIPFVYIHSL